jgi:hypothetical protein
MSENAGDSPWALALSASANCKLRLCSWSSSCEGSSLFPFGFLSPRLSARRGPLCKLLRSILNSRGMHQKLDGALRSCWAGAHWCSAYKEVRRCPAGFQWTYTRDLGRISRLLEGHSSRDHCDSTKLRVSYARPLHQNPRHYRPNVQATVCEVDTTNARLEPLNFRQLLHKPRFCDANGGSLTMAPPSGTYSPPSL